ncbi:HNH endonuclease signature motif containing protein, partial [Mycobacteroides immunogenum]|uniref:HNH endonuclease signature motif containing protein n=1 Tax=Mycobacteroides immunogenum TaxID=83262 RepID=UPI000AA160EA
EVQGAGTRLPMRDLIRMATHAHHYLAIFDDNGRALYLGRSKRIATPEQRLVLHARDRGCTHPGCHVPGYLCEVHHITEWAHGGPTDIDNLTFACGPHHRLLGHGWNTRKRPDGTTEWIPPPQLMLGEERQLTPSY